MVRYPRQAIHAAREGSRWLQMGDRLRLGLSRRTDSCFLIRSATGLTEPVSGRHPPRGETEFWIDERTPETPPQFEPLDVAVWLPHAGRCLFDIGQFCE